MNHDALRRIGSVVHAHLTDERSLITAVMSSITSVRRFVVARQMPELEHELSRLKSLQQQRQELTATRQQIQQQISAALSLPMNAATLSQLIRALDNPIRDALAREQAELTLLVREADRLNRINLAMLKHFSDLAVVFLDALTGTTTTPRYGRDGHVAMRSDATTFNAHL